MTDHADAAISCRFLPWDSEFFRLRIASCTPPPPDSAGFDRALGWCRRERIDCLYLLSDVAELPVRRLAEDHGFRLVDVRMTFGLEDLRSRRPDASPSESSPRLARVDDLPELRSLAAASHTKTRFWSDERFDRAACAELYATWIERSVRGQAEAVWVAEHGGRIAGYLSCHLRGGNRGEIGLVAVAPAAQGRGVGRALVERGSSWFREQGCERITVVTQGSSLAAQRLYESSGFRASSVELWHHRWFDPTGRERT